MKIDPEKAKIMLVIPCPTCNGTGVITNAAGRDNVAVYETTCWRCNGKREAEHEIPLKEFLGHLVVPTTADLHCTVDNPVCWREWP